MDEMVRSKMHEALDVEQPAGDLRSRVIASLPFQESPNRSVKKASFQWVASLVAVFLTVVLVAVLLYSRGSLSPTGSASPVVGSIPAGPFAYVSMMSATSGWADIDQTGHPRHTTDGGAHWTDVSPPAALMGGISSDYFLDADHAWVVDARWGSRVQLLTQRTIDGGRSWQQGAGITFDVGASSGPDANAQGGLRLDFLDPQHGWLFVGTVLESTSPVSEPHRDALYRTSDGGSHWRLVSTNAWSFTPAPFTSGCPWGAPVFISLTTGYMFSPDRTYETGKTSNCPLPNRTSMHVTHDGGVTWQFQPLPAQFGTSPVLVLDAPDFVDQLHGFLVLQTQGGSSLLATSDGGSSWEVRSLPGGTSDLSISWLDDRNGSAFVFTPGTPTVPLYRTRDGGATWTPVLTNLVLATADGQISDLYFVDVDTGFAFRRDAQSGGYRLMLKTTDGGRTWMALGRFN
jgi:photosystem II stability/assembly factor-like uncharacterized protein